MTRQEFEDLAIEFDELGMQPAIPLPLNEYDNYINKFHKAFKEIYKDYEIYELLKKFIYINKDGIIIIREGCFVPNANLPEGTEEYNKKYNLLKEMLDNE